MPFLGQTAQGKSDDDPVDVFEISANMSIALPDIINGLHLSRGIVPICSRDHVVLLHESSAHVGKGVGTCRADSTRRCSALINVERTQRCGHTGNRHQCILQGGVQRSWLCSRPNSQKCQCVAIVYTCVVQHVMFRQAGYLKHASGVWLAS